ncbi:hypothetical protein AGDE_16165 [Angomonas deanei]|nr:hypothetical protein AGDE_16165 [Angomonas deanei]|eukprot:EPY17591.1 hypothetical protein AGDE_16165 [Angomonas deanei]
MVLLLRFPFAAGAFLDEPLLEDAPLFEEAPLLEELDDFMELELLVRLGFFFLEEVDFDFDLEEALAIVNDDDCLFYWFYSILRLAI